MSISFLPNGNSTVVTANTTSGSTVVRIPVSASTPQIGAFMIDNLDTGNVVMVNIGYANTVQANQGNATPGTAAGFAVSAYATKYVNLHQGTNVSPPGNVYVVANAVSGTAQVAFTPVYIYK